MSRGILTGHIKTEADIPDNLKIYPRYQGENLAKNLELVRDVETLAKQKGCTPAQLAINWVKAQSKRNGNPVIIPIPGATTAARVEENSKDITLTDDELKHIDGILKSFGGTAGARYWKEAEAYLEG